MPILIELYRELSHALSLREPFHLIIAHDRTKLYRVSSKIVPQNAGYPCLDCRDGGATTST
ncbi:hypothetical protein B0T44_05915 [Nocardia donostiensis]|uniref:Uncharacterized protein n=1 Tax=Nocardia donostiensis TaxID=1538463 RepID=A0A1V2TK62_9NOCA|nr:hypothetical protein B0T46_05625 [Nocardia donostiensis]OQS13439.1 hypothetical protein B0T36_20350 [Nocardia donostiensis]OQS22184.1 hypothetical protein B0T44_05915 [Nocardia donostiensis]